MKRNLEALLALLDARLADGHAFGDDRNDCIAFANAAVKAQTGRNPARGLSWTGQTGALRALKRHGGGRLKGSIEAILDARFERIAPAFAMRGDIAGVPDELLGLHPAIVEGETLALPGHNGLKRVPRRRMVAAWSVTKPKKRPSKAKASAPAPAKPTGAG